LWPSRPRETLIEYGQASQGEHDLSKILIMLPVLYGQIQSTDDCCRPHNVASANHVLKEEFEPQTLLYTNACTSMHQSSVLELL